MDQTSTRPFARNRILAALSPAEFARLEDDMEAVELSAGQVLYEPGDALEFIHFPLTCVVSLLAITENGSAAELAMTGADGLVGIAPVLGGKYATHKAVVQRRGSAVRMHVELLNWELAQPGILEKRCLRYVQAVIAQMAQSVVCNRHHSVTQRLARWLLAFLDHAEEPRIDITQEIIANVLGVRREAVNEAARKLLAAGAIEHRRSQITVVDRSLLEAHACECYALVKAECESILGLAPLTAPPDRARPNPATLRARAESRLQQISAPVTEQWENTRLLHELQVHQIELEMINDELRLAYDEADAVRRKYVDLYEFAPFACITLDHKGFILQLNIAGSILLGMQRSKKQLTRFEAYVEPEFLPAFVRFHKEVLLGKRTEECELRLNATSQRPPKWVRIQGIADESGSECRMVLIDMCVQNRDKDGAFDAVCRKHGRHPPAADHAEQ